MTRGEINKKYGIVLISNSLNKELSDKDIKKYEEFVKEIHKDLTED